MKKKKIKKIIIVVFTFVSEFLDSTNPVEDVKLTVVFSIVDNTLKLVGEKTTLDLNIYSTLTVV